MSLDVHLNLLRNIALLDVGVLGIVVIIVESIMEEKPLMISGGREAEEQTQEASAARRASREKKEETKTDEPSLLPLVVKVEVRASPSALLRYIDAVEHVQELTVVKSFLLERSKNPDKGNDTGTEYILFMDVIFYLQDYEDKRS